MTRRRPLVVGLTGGIGAGKSTVLEILSELGALTIDSDEVAREVVEPGGPGYSQILAEFGPGVVGADGRIDRKALASRVFTDERARRRLEGIVHPLVRAEIRRRVADAPTNAIVVNAVPLLVEAGLVGEYDRILVVEAPLELRIERLQRRGISRDEALRRMAAQADDDARRAVAWRVITNDGSLAQLRERVLEVWRELTADRS
ncbi:MAG: dephospho-CoA kinase [Acidothermus sp.]|nr:dephospho-CoA kinase [Acidothermus sp.]MCL6538786.1 dephospho-CoA kinase [Acidothermus sp.]